MKLNIKRFAYLLGTIGVFLLASNAYSQPTERYSQGHEAMREKVNAQMLEAFKQLDLSPEQEKQLKTHRKRQKEQGEGVHESIRAKREEMKIELQKQELNMAKINKINSDLKNIKSKKSDQRLESILEVKEILTAEQFAKFMDLKKEFHPMMKCR
ncbi:MAG: periplasmic heavy metal sensor [Candidatus Brocadiaceae bacterium]|nr:periplasmic heavy metal sensor [Candidatus Brocadiaceae bacterium]